MRVVSRQEWGARAPRSAPINHVPSSIVVHHTSAPTAAQFAGSSTIRGIQAFHMDTRGWADIGYHFVIAPSGVVFAGRPPTVVGAHCTPNRGKVGICLIGNFEGVDTVPALQRASLVRLLAQLCAVYKIKSTAIVGHRDHNNTDCPGARLYADLEAIRTEVARA